MNDDWATIRARRVLEKLTAENERLVEFGMKIEEWSGVPIEKSEWEKWAKQILDSTTIRHTLSGDTIAIASYPEGPHGQRPERVYICKVLYTVKPEPPAPEVEQG